MGIFQIMGKKQHMVQHPTPGKHPKGIRSVCGSVISLPTFTQVPKAKKWKQPQHPSSDE